MVFGAILAGGKGTRMGIDKPKQFLMLGSRPIIIHTIEKFILSPDIDEIYVGVHPDWIDYTEDLIKKYIDSDKNIILVPGGTDRNSTIFNIIDEIEKRNGDDEDNIIVTHDSVRPFVTLRIIGENVEMAKECGAVDTVISAVDTIVVSEDGEKITSIPDRRQMFQGQTPQTFKISKLKFSLFVIAFSNKSSSPSSELSHTNPICLLSTNSFAEVVCVVSTGTPNTAASAYTIGAASWIEGNRK